MTTLIVSPKTSSELKLVEKLLKGLGIATHSITEEEREDIGLTILMKQANRTKKVSRASIMKKLG